MKYVVCFNIVGQPPSRAIIKKISLTTQLSLPLLDRGHRAIEPTYQK